MGQGICAVLADFDEQRRDVLERAFASRGFAVVCCDTGTTVLERCRESPPTIVVLDVLLPKKNGFEVLKALREDSRTAGIKVLLTLDEGDDYGEHRGRLCGADAICRRPIQAEQIVAAAESCLQEALGEGRDNDESISDDADVEAMLEDMEGRARTENPLLEHITDPLTGLYNQPFMALRLAEEFKKARRFSEPMTCILIGFDQSETLRSSKHSQGLRRILMDVAGLLLCESRDIDSIGVHDAERFFLLLPHTEIDGATTMTSRILKSIEGRAFEIPGKKGPMTGSAGIALFDGANVATVDELVSRCQEALSLSHKWGGNRFTVWSKDAEKAPRT
jgi:two-component system cell cycle response regulator